MLFLPSKYYCSTQKWTYYYLMEVLGDTQLDYDHMDSQNILILPIADLRRPVMMEDLKSPGLFKNDYVFQYCLFLIKIVLISLGRNREMGIIVQPFGVSSALVFLHEKGAYFFERWL